MRWILFSFLLIACQSLYPHDMPISLAKIVFTEDGSFTIELRFDVDTTAASYQKENPALLNLFIQYSRARLNGDAEKETEQLARVFCSDIRLDFNGTVIKPQLSQLDLGPKDNPARYQTAILHGQSPKAHTRCRWMAQEFLKIVNLQIISPDQEEVYVEIIQDYGDSGVYAGVPSSRWDIAVAYIYQGILHIIPQGLDHLLFIIGLFFAMRTFRQALWLVTTFTIAHSITLILVASGMSAPTWLQVCVEPIIALSIAVIAIENCCFKQMQSWRPLVVFLFGLIHGMGFASVLSDLGIPDSYFWVALLSFNIGVEIAQIAVIALAALIFMKMRTKEWYRPYVIIPSSLLIGIFGLIWFVGHLIGE